MQTHPPVDTHSLMSSTEDDPHNHTQSDPEEDSNTIAPNSENEIRPHNYNSALDPRNSYLGSYYPQDQPDFPDFVERVIEHYHLAEHVLTEKQFFQFVSSSFSSFYEREPALSASQFADEQLGFAPVKPPVLHLDTSELAPVQASFKAPEHYEKDVFNQELYDADVAKWERSRNEFSSKSQKLARAIEHHNREVRNYARAGYAHYDNITSYYKEHVNSSPIDPHEDVADAKGGGTLPYYHPRWGACIVRKPKLSAPTKPNKSDPKYRTSQTLTKDVVNQEAYLEAKEEHHRHKQGEKNRLAQEKIERIDQYNRELETYRSEVHQLITGGEFQKYLDGLGWRVKPQAKLHPYFEMVERHFDVRSFLFHMEPTRECYKIYIGSLSKRIPELRVLFEPQPLTIPFKLWDISHTYCTGMTRSGKSTLMQSQVFQLIKKRRGEAGVCVLDPHADFGLSIAKYKRLSEKPEGVFLFDPTIGNISLNPFDIGRNATQDAITFYTATLADAISQICGTEAGLTHGMITILRPSVKLLLYAGKQKPCTFMDLMRLIGSDGTIDRRYTDCIKYLNPADRQFMTYPNGGFYSQNAVSSRMAIQNRLQSFLGNDRFYAITCAHPLSSVSIKELVDHRAILLWCLRASHLGEDGAYALGRLVLATISAIGQIHNQIADQKKRPPLFVFADEAQNFISDSSEFILTELTKSNKLLTMGTQLVGQDMPSDYKKAVMGNTNFKFVGCNDASQLRQFVETTGVDLDHLLTLTQGKFCLSITQNLYGGQQPKPRIFTVSDAFYTKKDQFQINDEGWNRFIEYQKATYYLPDTPQTDESNEELPETFKTAFED